MGIIVKDEKIIVNNNEEFIFGGEFHYFRVPQNEWEDRAEKIKAAGFNLVSTYIPWNFHEQVEGNIDLVGRTSKQKDLARFLKLLQEKELMVLVRPGPYIMSEVRGHGIPLWVKEKYEELIAIKDDGKFHEIVSLLHPKFLELVDNWYKEVFKILSPIQITNGGNVIMVQLDNEVGMFPWVMNMADFSPHVLERYFKYLEKRNLSSFNLSNIDLKELVINKKLKIDDKQISIKLHNEFLLFNRLYIFEYLSELKKIATNYGLDVPVVINVHGFDSSEYAKRGKQYPIGLSQLYESTKIEDMILAGDYYIGNIVPDNYFDIILANSFTKAIQPKHQPLFSAEFQGGFQNGVPKLQPTTIDLNTRLCIANGMNAINYYMFVGGYNYDNIGLMGRRHDWQAPISAKGELRRQYFLIQHLVSVIKSYGKSLLDAKLETNVNFGLVIDYYMTEFTNNNFMDMRNELHSRRDMLLFDGLGKALAHHNYSINTIDLVKEEEINPLEIESLWVFSTKYMDLHVQEKLVNYVKNGGRLIISPELPTLNLKNEDCTFLIDELEIIIDDTKHWQFCSFFNEDSIPAVISQSYVGAENHAFREEDNKCLILDKKIDKGNVVVFGAGVLSEHEYKMDVYRNLLEHNQIKTKFKTSEWLNLSIRKGDQGSFLFIHNFDEYDKDTIIYYEDQPLFDEVVMKIRARCGLILPINWKVNEYLEIIYATAEITNVEITSTSTKISIKKVQDYEFLLLKTSKSVLSPNNEIIQLDHNQVKIIFNKKENNVFEVIC